MHHTVTSAPHQIGSTAPRHAGFDAPRGALAVLVVLHHSAINYGVIGDWYYHERLPDGALPSTLLVFFCTFNQAYFMGLFFCWPTTTHQWHWRARGRAAS